MESRPQALITATGRPTPEFREQLRRIPNLRNAFALAWLYTQTVAIVVAAVHFDNWVVWIAAFVLIGRSQAQHAALMHEAAHRLLFRDRSVNDFVGRWLVAVPAFRSIDAYRRGHMAHHREEFGPEGLPEDDQRYSVRATLNRRRRRSGNPLTKAPHVVTGRSEGVADARAIVVCQVLLIAIGVALHHPWVYFVLWLLPYLTIWRATNALRALAEHGGMQRSEDGRLITPAVRQSPLARFYLVPFHTGWHLAHHVDAGVPMSQLPRLHDELKRAGFLPARYEFRTYTSLWRKLARGEHLAR